MRGKEYCFNKQLKFSRITPAYAGKSRAFRLQFALLQDHPRLCGEKLLSYPHASSSQGSPPPMRGKAAIPDDEKQDHKDHPRLCGEKRTCLWLKNLPPGSPPPMRGKDSRRFVKRFLLRITPAYAGKRLLLFRRRQLVWDHPRLCGEKEFEDEIVNSISGSPPPMRGKAPSPDKYMSNIGITPAYAGKR